MEFNERPCPKHVKLLAIKLATASIVDLGDGVDWIKNRMDAELRQGFEMAFKAIDTIRNCEDPNPYTGMSDDEIAKAILEEAAKKGMQS